MRMQPLERGAAPTRPARGVLSYSPGGDGRLPRKLCADRHVKRWGLSERRLDFHCRFKSAKASRPTPRPTPKVSPKPRRCSSNAARSSPKASNSSCCDSRLPSGRSKNDGGRAASAVLFCMQAFFSDNPVLNVPKTPIEPPAASAAHAAAPTGPSPRKATPTQAGTARLMNLVAKEKAVSMAKMSTAHFVFSFVPPPTCFSGVHHFVADLMMSPARMRNVAPCPVAIQQFTRLV
mmetsp:Transcript_30759/g.87807  ORF Transcript_30759/g.87807 Transcript_30759/m.87807 type:complete len:234 (+) Transcript_30759:267-968(+)